MSKPKKPPSEATPPVKQTQAVTGPNLAIGSVTPWTVFTVALKAVPALRYALAVLGIVSAIAIIKGFGVDFQTAVYGTIIMLILMVALVVFAALTKVRSPQVRWGALLLMWSFLLITILSAALLFTSAFFEYPRPLGQLLSLTNSSDPRVIPKGGPILTTPPEGTPKKVTIEDVSEPEKGASVPHSE